METKICGTCRAAKPSSEFYEHKYKTQKGEKRYLARSCKACYKKQVVQNKRDKWEDKYKEYQANARKRIRPIRAAALAALVDELKKNPCTDCQNTFPAVCMDFDHKDRTQKRYAIPQMISNGMSEEAVLHEIAKCDLVCANCHRIRTAIQLGWRHQPSPSGDVEQFVDIDAPPPQHST